MKTLIISTALALLSYSAMAQDIDESRPIETPEFFQEFVDENKDFHRIVTFKGDRVFRLTHPSCRDNAQLARLEPTILLQPVERPEQRYIDQEKASNKISSAQNNVNGDNNDNEQANAPNSDDDSNQNSDEDNEEDAKNAAQLPEQDIPLYGQWIERVLVKGCGKTVLVNHLASAYEKGVLPSLLPLVNGTTLLDPIDQPFAERAIADRLSRLEKPCQSSAFIINSNIIGYRSESGKGIVKEDIGYGWFEQWQVRACETNYTANVAILPDAKTRYRYIARLKEISPTSALDY